MENDNYRQLLDKVDQKFAEIKASHSQAMTCHQGCHGCCRAGLTVSRVEWETILSALRARPAVVHALRQLAQENPHAGRYCSFLTGKGQCSIYFCRPLICRSHGAPVRFRDGQDEEAPLASDVCPLNFPGVPLEYLPDSDFINIEILNAILALINEQAYGSEGRQRYPLELASFLQAVASTST